MKKEIENLKNGLLNFAEGICYGEDNKLQAKIVMGKAIDKLTILIIQQERERIIEEIGKMKFYNWNEETQRLIKDKISKTLNN